MISSGRRRRVSRTKNKGETGGGDEAEKAPDLKNETATQVALVQHKAKRLKETPSASSSSTAVVRQVVETTERREWGSKQPKPADPDVLKYALTTGGELARKSNEVKTKSGAVEKRKAKVKADDSEGDADGDANPGQASQEAAIAAESEEILHLRNALLNEIKEGEASLSCDKRGSRVIQNLMKEGTSEQIVAVFERLKPYIGHLIYDPFASHVVQALIDRCGTETSTSQERQYISEFCEQVSKANEWWAMMHDKSATHVARSCALALQNVRDSKNLAAVSNSLKTASQTDFRSAARNPTAAPFLTAAILAQRKEEERETLVKRLFSDERNDVVLDRKQFDSAVQDRSASRVLDQVLPQCSTSFVHDVVFELGFVAPYLQRSAKHAFANFVVQRVVEKLASYPHALARVFNECPVKDMIDFDRVGVLTALAKALATANDESEEVKEVQIKFVDSLVACGVVDRATQRLQQQQDVVSTKSAGEEGKQEVQKSKESVDAHVHLSLSETLSCVLSMFPSKMKDPLLHQLLTWDASRLVALACDPVGGKKLLEPILDGADHEQAYSVAKRFKGNMARLALDRFGVHVAKKTFHLLRKNDKIVCMEEDILPNKAKLVGYPHGSKFLSYVAAGDFAGNKKEWARKMESINALEKETLDTKKKESLKEEWTRELGI